MLLQEIRRYFNTELNEHIDLAVLDVPAIKTDVAETGTPHLVMGVYMRYNIAGEIIDHPEIMELGEAATKLTYTFGQEPGWARVDDVPPTGELPDPLEQPLEQHVGMSDKPELLEDVELPDLGDDSVPIPKANQQLLDEAERHFYGNED